LPIVSKGIPRLLISDSGSDSNCEVQYGQRSIGSFFVGFGPHSLAIVGERHASSKGNRMKTASRSDSRSARTRAASFAGRRRVALVVESSLGGGRATLRGFAEYVRQVDRWSVYYEPSHFQKSLPEWLIRWRGDGVVARVRNPILARQLLKLGVPLVDLSGNVTGTGIPVVQVDSEATATMAANHLVEHGLRAFAYCGIRAQFWSQVRQDLFRRCIAQHGYATQTYQLPPMDGKAWHSEAERERLARWIDTLPKPIGIMAANDWAGQKVLAACQRVGAMVPEEVAVVGVDNDEAICEISDPMLSSIDVRHDRLGFHAAELLDRLMRGKPAPKSPLIVGEPRLVVRRSTDVQTIADRDVAEAVRFIRGHACSRLHVQDVAAHVALSHTTLKRRFRRVLSRSVHDEINRVRMQRARELLAETKMTLAQIVHATGFHHQAYFGALFKAKTGMTPNEYRRTNATDIG